MPTARLHTLQSHSHAPTSNNALSNVFSLPSLPPTFNPNLDLLVTAKPIIPCRSHLYQHSQHDNTLCHTLHHLDPPQTIVHYVTHVIWNAHLQVTKENALTLFKWEPVTPPSISTLHALALITSQMPPTFRNITLQDLIRLANLETDAYHQQTNTHGNLDDFALLIHIISIQDLWKEWNSAGTA